jgi:hypothetical protein
MAGLWVTMWEEVQFESQSRESNSMRTKRLAGSRRCRESQLCVRFHRRVSANEQGRRDSGLLEIATAAAAIAVLPAF